MEENRENEMTEAEEKTEKIEEPNKTGAGDCLKCRLKSFSESYLNLVVGVGLLLAVAIWLGVKVHVLAGMGLATVAVCIYAICVEDGLRKKLGVAYTRVTGGVSLTVVDPKCKTKWDKTQRQIPARVMWLDVVALGGRTKKQKADADVVTLYLPVSVKKIEKDALDGMISLRELVYDGTEEQWNEVEKLADLSSLEIKIQNANANANAEC